MNSANSSLWGYCERQVCTSTIAINLWPAIFSAFHRSRYLVLVATSFKYLKSHPLSNINCGNDVEAKSFSGTTCNWSLTSWRVSWTGLVISAKSSTIFRINLSFFFFLFFLGYSTSTHLRITSSLPASDRTTCFCGGKLLPIR